MRIEPCASVGEGPCLRRRGDRRLNKVRFVGMERRMNAMGADIAHGQREISEQFTLHVQGPLLDVVAMRSRFDVAKAQGSRKSRLQKRARRKLILPSFIDGVV